MQLFGGLPLSKRQAQAGRLFAHLKALSLTSVSFVTRAGLPGALREAPGHPSLLEVGGCEHGPSWPAICVVACLSHVHCVPMLEG